MNTICCVKSNYSMHNYAEHSHSEWEIILNLYGNVTYTIDGKTFDVKENDLIILPPHVAHSAASDGAFADMYLRAKKLDFSKVHVCKDFDSNVSLLMDMLQKVMLEKESNYKNIADSILELIVQYVKGSIRNRYKYDFVDDMKNIIFENVSNSAFDLKAEIEKTGYDKDYFRRCFQFDLGKTPLEYLTDLRIDLAKSLLLQATFLSVEKVAKQCGFNDNLYFSTCFKKHVGISPTQYRKKHIN